MSEHSPGLETNAGDDLLAELADDFLSRHRAGEHPSLEEYAQKHPSLADRIRDLFPAMLAMEQPDFAATSDPGPTERVGATIGRYKLLERIGEGGFGVVYMAEQHHPVRRKVALKVVKPGMDSRQVLARFEAERQALAIMDHPNIAKVFDGGMTDSGRPYFVMELVKGVPITEFCDQQQLTPRQRLELFAHVCNAVQHAHTKGIIHRDLKPTNVLVSLHDTQAVVKVIDFGVAKALGQELTDKSLFTGFAQLVGTPLYMSPEQAGQSALDVDTRSDIYSLGVLLYELLTGTTPFDKERFRSAAHEEIRRIIREEEPPRPSTRLSQSKQSLPSVSARRQMEPAKLTKLVRGELDWIVMKALEKDRGRRYETANGLARDVERYLHDEPVSACPPSVAYRLRKFARRNRAAVITALAVVFVLVLLVAGLTVSNRMITASRNTTAKALHQKEQALADAQAQRQRAEESLLKARYETAVGHQSLAYLNRRTGNAKKAEALAQQSISILDELHRKVPGNPDYRRQLAFSHIILAIALRDSGRLADAQVVGQRSLALYTPLLLQHPDDVGVSHEVVVVYYVIGDLFQRSKQLDEAERYFERATALNGQHGDRSPSELGPVAPVDIASVYYALARLQTSDGRMKEAAELYSRGLKVHPDDHSQWYYAAGLYLWLGDVERYRAACREMLDRFEMRTDHQIEDRIAKTCALAPNSVSDFSRVERLADRSVKGTEAVAMRRYFVLAKAITEYRAGRHQQAVEWLGRYAPKRDGVHLDAIGFVLLSMAHQGLGQSHEARSTLSYARAIIAKRPPKGDPGHWPGNLEWMHIDILMREAEQLIGK